MRDLLAEKQAQIDAWWASYHSEGERLTERHQANIARFKRERVEAIAREAAEIAEFERLTAERAEVKRRYLMTDEALL